MTVTSGSDSDSDEVETSTGFMNPYIQTNRGDLSQSVTPVILNTESIKIYHDKEPKQLFEEFILSY